ncbi:MAG: mechanosensitive ion channel family protein [Ardenticatenaceae bacterium]|nr:mechanosensitive ion channel family protein [Ardenticatenaceae bacterium]
MIPDSLTDFQAIWWGRIALIALFYLLAWIFHHLSSYLAQRIVQINRFSGQRPGIRRERLLTLRDLVSSGLTFLGFGLATLFSLSLFVDADTLVWMIGLFSAAFGLGARPLISDFLTGVSFIFEDTFDVGEKVEFTGAGNYVEGVVEVVNLRTTQIRAPTGELLTVPNGEIRLVRNYSRGRFSVADITLKIETGDLHRAVDLLTSMRQDAVTLLPNLLEPWQIISTSGEMGQQTELTLVAKARFGKAAEMRPRLLTLVQERLTEAGISLVG